MNTQADKNDDRFRSGGMPWRLEDVDGDTLVIAFVRPNSYPRPDGRRPWDSEVEAIHVRETATTVTIDVRVRVTYPQRADSHELAVTAIPHEVKHAEPLGEGRLLHAPTSPDFEERFHVWRTRRHPGL